MAIRVFVVLVGVVLCSSAWADKPPPLDEAIKQAAAAHKPLVIEFGAAWCGPCKVFEAKVLPEGDVQKALQGVTFVRYDVDESPGDAAARKLSITGYPTFVVLDASGVEVARDEGYLPAKQFIALLDRARHEALGENDIRLAIKQKPNDVPSLLVAAQWFALHKKNDEAIVMFEKVSTSKLATAEQRAQATAMLIRLRRMKQWKAQLAAEKAALVRASLHAAAEDDVLIATVGSDIPATEAHALIKAVLEAETDPDRLNHLVYVALAAHANDDALAAAKRLVAGKRSAQYLDTLAECYHARGDRKLALETEDDAIGFSRYDSILATLQRNRARFEKGGDEASIVAMRKRAQALWARVDRIDQLEADTAEPELTADDKAQRDQFMKLFNAQRSLASTASKACENEAAGNGEAIARIVVAEGAVKSAVLLCEASATSALRDCLTKQIVGAKFDAEVKTPKLTLTISFASRH
jgi:thioredoxin-related protein